MNGSERIKASFAAGFSVEVIESKFARRSAVRSGAWLGLLGAKGDDKVARSMARATKAKIKMTLDLRSIVFDAVMREDAA